MLSSILRNRVQIQQKESTLGATGETVNWKPVQYKYALVLPLDVRARAVYQSLDSYVSHKIVLRGDVTLSLGDYRIKHGTKTYEPVEPAQLINGNTVVVVKEV